VGVAATSVYLHFDDIESLLLAVAERRFSELMEFQDEATDAGATACERVRAGSVAYCEFGLKNPGHYQLMFTRQLTRAESMVPSEFPGYAAFRKLIDWVAECIGADSDDTESFRTAMLIWQQLHGTVSLRISRPRFPWPPLDQTVADVVDRILAARTR
jgi:AcrR family transcriptional regulator